MRRKIAAGIFAAAAVGLLFQPAAVFAQTPEKQVDIPELAGENYEEGEILVLMRTTQAAELAKEGAVGTDRKMIVEECWDFGTAENARNDQQREFISHIHSDVYSTEELMEKAAQYYYVDAVAPNSYAVLCKTADTMRESQWYLDGSTEAATSSAGICYDSLVRKPSSAPVVAVIDTGVDYKNEDLENAMWKNPYESKVFPGTYGYDFAEGDPDPMDTCGHGTHCAGIIAATADNGKGIAGISNARIMALKVCRDGREEVDTIAVVGAFYYITKAQELGVEIAAVNCSWGGSEDTNKILDTLIDRVGENGAVTVFAAGNSAVDWDSAQKKETPYDLESSYVIKVGASDENDRKAFFSDYGASSVDLFAPGSNILSTVTEPVFAPQFWSEADRKETVLYYNKVDSCEGLLTAADIGIKTPYSVELTYDAGNGYPDARNGAVMYKAALSGIPTGNSQEEQAGFIYVDVTDWNLDPASDYYVSCMCGSVYNTGDIEWNRVQKKSTVKESRFIVCGDRTYMALIGLKMEIPGTSVCYFDDFAISVANLQDSKLKEYDTMSGTSMAAPMVSAAAAIVKGENHSAAAQQVRTAVVSSVRKVEQLKAYCKEGGVLDLGKLAAKAEPVVVKAQKIKLNKQTATVRYGKSLQLKATITPSGTTNKKVKWSTSNKKYAAVSSKGLVKVKKAGIGHKVKITAQTTDGTALRKTCTIFIEKKK